MEIAAPQLRFEVHDPTGAGEIRRAAVTLAGRMGFNEVDSGKLALLATELAQNISVHAKSGEVLLRALDFAAIELLAIDRGPGMRDVGECMRDGFSTAGTQGIGLGALARTSTSFDIYTQVGQGTVIRSELRSSTAAPELNSQRPPVQVGIVSVAMPGQSVCGDGWRTQWRNGRWRALVADGLGHGVFAEEASQEAIRVFERNTDQPIVEVMHRLHDALRKTRGAAAAIVNFNPSQGDLGFAGVGNISATLLAAGKSRSMVSHNGTLGAEMRRVQEFAYPWPADALLVMHSDGLATHWKLDGYPGLLQRHPAVIAGVLYRDFKRSRDDVTVLCARRVAAEK
jgi:anti-sigma regulatory factor (Ser/Thr protein kinase)